MLSAHPRGRQATLEYAANGINLLRVKQITAAHPAGELVAELGMYGMGPNQYRPFQYTDASRRTYMLNWNAFGQLTSVLNPKNESTAFVYDHGYLMSIQQQWAGPAKTTGFTYDTFG